jgi:transcriptional regulator with XRE-family HTH domain
MQSHTIKLIRTLSGKTQVEFAAALDIDQGSLSRIEHGERDVPRHVEESVIVKEARAAIREATRNADRLKSQLEL